MNAINNNDLEINDLEMGMNELEMETEINDSEYEMMKFYWPVITLLMVLIIWGFFIWGIIGLDKSSINMSMSPISPPLETFPFITVNDWPSCTSARGNSWRLVSSQLTHAGLQHIVLKYCLISVISCTCMPTTLEISLSNVFKAFLFISTIF